MTLLTQRLSAHAISACLLGRSRKPKRAACCVTDSLRPLMNILDSTPLQNTCAAYGTWCGMYTAWCLPLRSEAHIVCRLPPVGASTRDSIVCDPCSHQNIRQPPCCQLKAQIHLHSFQLLFHYKQLSGGQPTNC